MRSKKKVRWDSDATEFASQAAWGGIQRDMAVVRDKLGCKHDVSELYSPPRVVKMARIHMGSQQKVLQRQGNGDYQ